MLGYENIKKINIGKKIYKREEKAGGIRLEREKTERNGEARLYEKILRLWN